MKTKNVNYLKTLLFLISTSVLFFACKKNIFPDAILENPTVVSQIDFTTKVNSNVSGFVTNENNFPVIGAAVKVGSVTTTTNRFGFFEVKNVQVVKTAATVTIVNAGYFNGIKTYMAEDGKAAFFRIKLLPKTSVGTITAASGGTVTSNGVKVSLPANAVVNAATNVAYVGNISVAIKFLNPTSAEINNIMPGDLRGIDGNSNLKLLTSYGMAAVELTGSAGELLQIATGKKATLIMPIPASIVASAPASIPLWYFDEAKGLWKEEGSATKTGAEYIGEVSHFSFWNCDVPNNYVQFNCTVKNSNGDAMSAVWVKISVISNPSSVGYGYSDASGYVSGFIPDNSNLKLEILSDFQCNVALLSQNFSTTNANVSLGVISVPVSAINFATVSGTVTNCSNLPVTNGVIYIRQNNIYRNFTINSNGSFSFSRALCNGPEAVQIVAEDLIGSQQSQTLNTTISAGNNSIGNLQACGTSTSQYLNISINGVAYNYTSPQDFFNSSDSSSTPNRSFSAYRQGNGNQNTYFYVLKAGIGLNTIQPLVYFSSGYINENTTIPNPVNVNITEYGAIGQYISGNFAGIVIGANPPNTNYNIVCSFRMKRNQ